MEKNVGSADKTVRIIIGIILFVFGLFYTAYWWGIVAIIIGAVLFVTGLLNRCPAYVPFKISTAKKKTEA